MCSLAFQLIQANEAFTENGRTHHTHKHTHTHTQTHTHTHTHKQALARAMVMKVMIVIMVMRIIMKIINRNSYMRVLPIVATKYFHQFFYKN